MTVITHARRETRLSRMIDAPGGVSVQRALEQARTNLAPLRTQAVGEITRQIAVLAAAEPPAHPTEAAPALERLYLAATAIIDAAGPFDMDEVCYAAAALCDLIDADDADRPFDWRVPPVVAGSLTVLLALPAEARDERRRVCDGLAALFAAKLATI